MVIGVTALLLGPWQPTASSASSPPILLVTNSNYTANPFGPYLGEILRAEGINTYDNVDLASNPTPDLAPYKIVILAETTLTGTPPSLFITYVNGGGKLIAMRPDPQIMSLFGLNGLTLPSQTDGYLKFDNTQPAAQGLTTSVLQIHGETDRYDTVPGTTTIAQLYSSRTTATSYPAVTLSADGRAVAFLYDLARNVAYTRQGNRANANKIYGSIYLTDTQGISGTWDIASPPVTRTTSLFQLSNLINNPQWIDKELIPIPQADEQMRLLARLVQQLMADQHPLPQLWYFPGAAKTMLILTGDAHANTQSFFDQEINSINSKGGKITLYVTDGGFLPTDPGKVAMQTWYAQGHSFGVHPYAPLNDAVVGYPFYVPWFNTTFAPVPMSRTVRNHQVAWQGWTDAADIAASNGIAMDTSFYHWGPWLKKADNSWPHGYLTGSGQPMKFIRENGSLTSVYQQNTHLVDEQLIGAIAQGGFNGWEGLTGLQAIAVSRQLIDASQAGDYAALATQFHIDYYGFGDPQVWAEGTLDYANSLGVPIWSADQWLNFTEARHDAAYNNIAWDSSTRTLSFSVTATNTAGITLTHVLPLMYNGYGLQTVTMDGSPRAFSQQTIKGQQVAFIETPAGTHSFTAAYTGPLPGGTLTYTTYNDFAPGCAVYTDTIPTDISNGAVTLAGQLHDGFNGTSLNSQWSSGAWPVPPGGPYNPTFSNGVMTLSGGGWVRSQSVYTTPRVIESVAEFGNGANQHIGFADDGFLGNRYFIFSTLGGGSNLYARVNNNASEQSLNLGAIPSGFHRYRIEWSNSAAITDTVRFYLDGGLVFSADVNSTTLTPLYFYFSNNGVASLRVDWGDLRTPYKSSGTSQSCTLDAGENMAWQTASWDTTLPSGTVLQARTSLNGSAWSDWATIATSGGAISQSKRYAQYRLLLVTSDVLTTPVVNSVTLGFEPSVLALTKSDGGRTNVTIGETIPYTLTITPPQPTAYGLIVTDTLPAGMIYIVGSQSVSGLSPAPTFTVSAPNNGTTPVTLTWNFGSAATFTTPSATLTLSATVASTSGIRPGQTLTNTVAATYKNSFGALQSVLNASDSVAVVKWFLFLPIIMRNP